MTRSVEGDELPRKVAMTTKQCFTKVQQRQFWVPIRSSIRLCPSMDLIAYEQIHQQQTTSSTLLNIHRTLNWQKIASILSSSQLPLEDQKEVVPTSSRLDTENDLNNVEYFDVESQTIEWRPDGRFIAVAIGETIHIYSVDGLLMAMSSTMDSDMFYSASGNDMDGHDNDSEGIVGSFSIELLRGAGGLTEKQNFISSVSWVHSGTWSEHRLWPSNTSNQNTLLERQYYHKLYADRWNYVLPPSDYHFQNNSLNNTNGLPELKHLHHYHSSDESSLATIMKNGCFPIELKPFSVLCVTTLSGHLHLYLHGRYRIASNIPLSSPLSLSLCLPIVTSPDLTHLISATAASNTYAHTTAQASSEPNNFSTVTILSFSTLSKHRKFYHSFSLLYCRIVQHMDAIRQAIPEIYASWKTSLKPIDLKLDGLQKLLHKYGLVAISSIGSSDEYFGKSDVFAHSFTSVRSLLVQYILSGHSRTAPTLSNAVDQFFTGVQMNDQLLQRMGHALSSAVSNIESNVRKQLVAPATALIYDIDQLYGLSAYRTDLLLTEDALSLLHSAQQLFLVASRTLTNIIEVRCRLRDFVSWLRYTGANIKARGTAMNSVQRENAKKRRVSESVVQKVLFYLQEQEGDSMNARGGITETLLHLRFAETLRESSCDSNEDAAAHGLSNLDQHHERCLPLALEMTRKIADQVFEYPRSPFAQSMHRTDILLPRHDVRERKNFRYCLAVVSRLGQGGIDPDQTAYGDDKPEGFFSPIESSNSTSRMSQDFLIANIRQWLMVAETIQVNSIRLRAFALTWTRTEDDEFDRDVDAFDGLEAEAEWTVNLSLPSEYTIHDVAFFGDDGKSSLVTDVGCIVGGKEGRHRLGLLASRSNHSITYSLEDREMLPSASSSNTESVELWVVPYDDLEYERQSIEYAEHSENAQCASYRCSSHLHSTKNMPVYSVIPQLSLSSNQRIDEQSNDAIRFLDNDSAKVLYARTRKIFASVDFSKDVGNHSRSRTCRLFLSGSRGIGAVSCRQQGSTLLQILELEEDEEEEEEQEYDDEVDDPDAMEEETD